MSARKPECAVAGAAADRSVLACVATATETPPAGPSRPLAPTAGVGHGVVRDGVRPSWPGSGDQADASAADATTPPAGAGGVGSLNVESATSIDVYEVDADALLAQSLNDGAQRGRRAPGPSDDAAEIL